MERWSYANRAACRACTLRPQCTNTTFRKVARWIDEAVLDRMEARLVARPEILDRRREIVEHPFGSIKQWMNQGAFLMRGLSKVGGEFSLTALAYNLTRAINLVGVPKLLKRSELPAAGISATAGKGVGSANRRRTSASPQTMLVRQKALRAANPVYSTPCSAPDSFHTVCLVCGTFVGT